MANQVTKIYELKTLGFNEIDKELKTLEKDFIAVKKAKQDAAKSAADAAKSQGVESEAYKAANQKLQEQKVALMEVQAEQKRLRTEKVAMANATIAESNTTTQKTTALRAEAGSYQELYRSYRQLYLLTKNAGTNSTIQFQGNAYSYDAAIAKLKELSTAEQNWRRQFTRDGLLVAEYTSGIVQAFKKMGLDDIISDQINKAKTQVRTLDSEFEQLKNELSELRVSGSSSFSEIEKKLIDNRKEAQQLTTQVSTLENEFRKTSDVGTQITQGIANGFKEMKGQVAQFLLGYVGFQAALSKTQELIGVNKELSDQYTDLQRVLGATDEEFSAIAEGIRNINTRTDLNKLFDFAFIASKAGVAKDQIVGVTKSLDQLYLVAGKSLGDPEQTFESLVKLNTIFNDGAPVTADNLQKLGNALVQLDNEGVASGKFMVDFAQRLAGVEGITKIQIKSVLGLAAAFEENGATAEVAATATSQVLVKMYADTQKYADIAKMTKEAFEDLLNTNPGEALLRVAQGLKGNASAATEFAANFSQLDASGARIQATMGTLAAKTDYFRNKIESASVALNDNQAIIDGAEKKNNNLASSFDRIKKAIDLVGTSTTAQVVLSTISSILLLIIGNLPILLTLIGLWAVGWAAANRQLVIQNAQLLLLNTKIIASRILMGALTIAQNAYNITIGVFTGAVKLAKAATQLWGLAIKSLPFGWLIAIIGVAIGLLAAVGSAIAGNTHKLGDNARAFQRNLELQSQVNEQTSGTISKIKALTNATQDHTISLDARKKALQELINISPEYLGKLTLENIKTAEGKRIIDEYVGALEKKARAEAIYAGLQKAQQAKNEADLNTIKAASDSGFAKSKYKEQHPNWTFTSSVKDAFKYGTLNSEQAAMKDFYSQQAADAQKDIAFYQKQLSKDIQQSTSPKPSGGKITTTVGARIDSLKGQIKSLEEQYNQLNATDKKGMTSNITQRKKLQSELEKLEGKSSSSPHTRTGASRISGTDRDAMSVIDTARNSELEAAKSEFLEKKKLNKDSIDEEIKYRQSIAEIEDRYDTKKISSLSGKNPATTLEKSKLRNGISERNLQLADDVSALLKKGFDKESNNENESYETQKSELEDQQEKDLQNISLSEVQKAQIIIDSHNKIESLTQSHLNTLKALSSKYHQDVATIDKQAAKVKKDNETRNYKDLKAVVEASYKDIENEASDIESNTKNKYLQLANNIMANNSLSDSKKSVLLKKNEDDLSHQLLVIAAQKALKILDQTKADYSKGNATQADLDAATENVSAAYNNLGVNEMGSRQKANSFQEIGNAGDWITKKGAALLGIKADSDEYKLFAQTAQDSFQMAQNAMSTFFDIEQQRIQNSLKLQEKQIDAQKRVALGKAQSAAEQDTIERQSEAKRLAAQKEAFEKNKKMQIAQAKVNLAMQLSNLAVVAFAPNPLNIATLGTAGAVMYAVQAALAIANYAMNVSRISAAQFASGGKIGNTSTVPVLGSGPINQPSNIPTQPNGDHILATVKRGEVILNASQQRALGGADTFKAIGVPGFASGGLASLASQYPAPIWQPSNSVHLGITKDDLDEFKNSIFEATNAANDRIDRIEVVQVTSSVTKAQKKEVQQQSIGRL